MAAPKVLVANRGESECSTHGSMKSRSPILFVSPVAIRIFRSSSELGWQTVALYTEKDVSHAYYADEAVLLDSPTRYMDPEYIADIARR